MSTTCEVHETIWSEIADDDTLLEVFEIAEDETLPEIREVAAGVCEIAGDETSPETHETAGSGPERAVNILLKLCQQIEMEKHGNEIQCQVETETRRTMWDIVEEIYRDWKVSPPPETVSRSRNGWRSFRICSQCTCR